jgi:hypothetical protein
MVELVHVRLLSFVVCSGCEAKFLRDMSMICRI